jgi:hypothetical protein
MTNRNSAFNRKKVNRAKTIRDKKRSRIRNKKRSINYQEEHEVPRELTKKEQRKQKRLDRILTDMNVRNTNIGKKKVIKRRNDRKKNKNSSSDKMEIES